MTSLGIYVLPIILYCFINQLNCNSDNQEFKNSKLSTILKKRLNDEFFFKKDKFSILDNQLLHSNKAKKEEDLFLDDEQDDDDDQISGSGDNFNKFTNSNNLYTKTTPSSNILNSNENLGKTNIAIKDISSKFNNEEIDDSKFGNKDIESKKSSKQNEKTTSNGKFRNNKDNNNQLKDILQHIHSQLESVKNRPDVLTKPIRLNQVNLQKECNPNTEFRCWNSTCIDKHLYVCNRQIDCLFGEDELYCNSPVEKCNPRFEIQCKNGKCININQLCDRVRDCPSGDDEENCELKCGSDEFQCKDKNCINLKLKCNGNFDCRDGSDELNCACKINEFRCDDGTCIPLTKRCDKFINCKNGSDERNCSIKSNCAPNEFECVETKKCINADLLCNNYFDCEDFSDELNCGKNKCKDTEFKCKNGKCIENIFICDRILDCEDGSDEDFCWQCRSDLEYTCKNGQCIKKEKLCDLEIDCRDFSDELNCTYNHLKLEEEEEDKNSKFNFNLNINQKLNQNLNQFSKYNSNLKVYPTYQTVQKGFTAVLRCRDEGDTRLPVSWFKLINTRNNTKKLIKLNKSSNLKISKGRLTIDRVEFFDDGIYICKTNLDSITTILSVVEENSSLNESMVNDEPPAFIDVNNLDEFNAKESSLCNYNEFACGNSNQCVSRLNHCDQFLDCIDGSDEIGCTPPMIVSSPDRQIIVAENENITLHCKAIGTPTPVISWLQNWNPIRSTNSHLVSSSSNGYGTLTIKGVQQQDTGKYICQARNNLDTTSAPYDSELIIKSKNGVCLPPTFNDDAKLPEQCIRCFCFNTTSTCYSSNLKIQTIPITTKLNYAQLVYDQQRGQYRELPIHHSNQDKVIYNRGNRQFILNSSIGNIGDSVIYWSLPEPFTGNLIKSYGGYLKYVFNYVTQYSSNKSPIYEADIIIKNDNYDMVAYHSFERDQPSSNDNQIQIKLTEHQFTKERSIERGFGRSLLISREEFLTLLQNVTKFYIRAKFDRSFVESKILDLELDVGVDNLAGNEHLDDQRTAKLVEKCSCPIGYKGTSCEQCSPGYYRNTAFHFGLGSCIRETANCHCFGNSNQCDSFNRCHNCQNNSEGLQCERCKRGFFGDPTRGIPCRKCDCPDITSSESNELIIDEEWSSGACVLDANGITSTCVSCPLGTEGSRCEKCAPNYIRDNFGKCRLIERLNQKKPTSSSLTLSNQSSTINCAENEFKCKEGRNCIPISEYCNGLQDCSDGSDEEACPNNVCDPNGSYNTYYNKRTRKCDCKPHVDGPRCQSCETNSFNFGGKNGCTKCYCMGASNECVGKNITENIISLNPTLNNLNLTTIDGIIINEEYGSLKLGELDTENSISFLLYTQNPTKKKPTNILYWKLPTEFLGNKLSYYNGALNYKIVYEHLKPDEQIDISPDLIFVGNNQEEVHYKHAEPIKSKTLTKVSIDIVEDSFTDAKGDPIRKDQLMNVLFDLNRTLIKASYTKDIVFTGIKEIELKSANQIESCNCGIEYKGDSCDQCANGYFKKPGSYYHQCIACDCNGNSRKCDPLTGKCLECDYNFEGDHCEKCMEGFILSRTRGFIECIPIQLINPTNYNGSFICHESVGTQGLCNRCKSGFYNLINGECTQCSCSGVTDKCRENYGYLNEIKTTNEVMQLKDKEFNRVFTTNDVVYDPSDQRYTFGRFEVVRDRTLYWELPIEFLGNKIKSYGYNLTYQIDIKPNDLDDVTWIQDADVEMKNKKITIVYLSGEVSKISETGSKLFNVPLKEDYWEKIDKQNRQMNKLTKLEFLDVLNDVQEILIRSVYHDKQQTTSISNIQLMTVDDEPSRRNNQKQLTNIEQCLCPIGYQGTSCEKCSLGYARNSEGLCVKCNCNGHSNKCIEFNKQQKCLDCLHNTEGPNCNQCAPGFYGDATLKTPNACKKCPCPTVRSSSNFASTCRQELETGEIICNCKEGYVGLNCGRCAPGFEPDLNYPNRCKVQLSYRNSSLYSNVPTPKITTGEETIVSSPYTRLRIDPNHLSQVVSYGETALLRCVAQSLQNKNSQLVPVVWIREGAQLPQQNRQTQGILEIFNAQPEDSGLYYCMTTDVDGSVLKLKAQLQVVLDSGLAAKNRIKDNYYDSSLANQQLNVRIEPRILSVRVNEPISLRCLVQGREPISITWFKSTATNELIPERRIINNELKINLAQYSDSGDYYCEGRGSQGSYKARSRVIVNEQQDDSREPTNNNPYYNQEQENRQKQNQDSMNVIVPPSVHILPERQTIIQGKSGTIHCMASGNPSPKIIWSKAREDLDPSRHIIVDSLNRSTLEIRDSNIQDRGLYICRAENTGGVIQATSIVEVERREIPAVTIYPSAVQVLPQDSSALFQCRIISGIPTPTIEWKKADGSDLEDDPNIEQLPGGVIKFTKLSPESQGRYLCIGESPAGRVTAEAQLHVQGSVQVRIRQTGPYRVRTGDRVRLDCNLSGQTTGAPPNYRIEWRKMISNNSQIQIPFLSSDNDSKSSLMISKVGLDDSGYYVCLGINTQNNKIIAQERIQLIVEQITDSFDSNLQVEDRVIRAQVDEPTEIRCFVRETNENIKLNWLKLNSNLPLYSRVEDGVLYIEKVKAEDDGLYVCTGYNEKSRTVSFTQKIRLAVVGQFGSASPRITITPSMQAIKVGDRAKIKCEIADDDTEARVHWTKLNSDSTRQSIKIIGNQDALVSVRNYYDQDRMRQVDDTLIIDNVNIEDQGYYLCTVVSSKAGTTEAISEILVLDANNPNANLTDQSNLNIKALRSQKSILGKSIVIRCPMRVSHYRIEWSFDQQELPENAIPNQYSLTLNDVQKRNEGRYICVAYDEKGSMRDRDYVYLTVIDHHNKECLSNQFSCGDSTCIGLELRCNNRYDCSDMSDEAGCEKTNSFEDEVELGGTLILECITNQNRQVDLKSPVKWYRMNGNQPTEQFSDNISIEGNKLRINNIRAENGGIYRCIIDGTFKDNIVTIKVQTKSAPLGTSIIMHCKSNVISNVQSYHWKQNDSPLPDNIIVKNNLLTIRNLNENNAAVYTCTVRNQTHRVDIPSILRVTSIIPLFSSNSFIGLKHYSPLNLNEIQISFTIKNMTNCLLLYAQSTKKQDFLAFIINNEHLEAKYDLGNGIVTLKSHGKLELNKWHSIRFKRHNLRALLEVDEQPEVEHLSSVKEKSVGLNLDDYWYIGGFKNYTHLNLDKKLQINSGFSGCISLLKIDSKKYSLMKSSFNKNIQDCDTCNIRGQKLELFQKLIDQKQNHLFSKNSNQHHHQHIHHLNQQLTNISSMINLPNNLCKNGGICQEALNQQGTKCLCKTGFLGDYCEKTDDGSGCLLDSCGPGGRCINLKKVQHMSIRNTNQQFICDCPINREGKKCELNVTINKPRFTGERSFITYSIPRESSSHLIIKLKLKLTIYQPDNTIRDALILYSAEKSNGGDFIALSIKDQKLQFLFNTGSGVTEILGDELIRLNTSWINVKLIRNGSEGKLIIFDKEYIGFSPGKTKGINLRLPLYVGYIDEQVVKLPKILKESTGFIGCINSLEINNQTIDLINHSIDSSNIKNCKVKSICSKNPCKNNGICTELTSDTYKCLCRPPFTGDNCEKNNGICAQSKPCHNKGKCLDSSSNIYFTDTGFKCCCLWGYSGRSCDIIENWNKEYSDKRWVNFDNSKSISYLVLENHRNLTEQVIELSFKTERFNGLIYYQGDLDFIQKDYLIMNLNDGYLEVEWNLGSGIGLIRSEESLNDGRKHQVIFKRKGVEGQLIVDIQNPQFTKSGGSLTQLNVNENNIYFGGYKEIELLTKFRPEIQGFSGCIGNIKLTETNEFLDLSLMSKTSCNVQPCT